MSQVISVQVIEFKSICCSNYYKFCVNTQKVSCKSNEIFLKSVSGE